MELHLILPWLSLAVGVIAISRFYFDRWDRAVEEGKMRGEIEQLRKDIDSAYAKMRDMENVARCVDVDIASIQSDIKHILSALVRIENKLEQS
jgi:archaellum component FlaC